MRTTLLCTVGTSLLSNIQRLAPDHPIRVAYDQQNWKQLSLHLLELDASDRQCGAEINSITSICQQEYLDATDLLIFLISDTTAGQHIGEILRLYYQSSKNPVRFQTVDPARIIVGLRDDDVNAFQRDGLKNLVREISAVVRKSGQPDTIAINATGGYKAQISFAGMIGQALGIPVYYLFEKFSKVIALPPQPLSLDLSLWLTHYPLFEWFEQDDLIPKPDFDAAYPDPIPAELQTLLEEDCIDKPSCLALSAMGLLFHERCREQFKQQEKALLPLIPQDETDPEQKRIRLSPDHHGNNTLAKAAKKLVRSPHVQGILNSLPYNPHQTQPIRRTKPNGIIEFVLVGTDQGLGLCIQTTGRTLAETNTIAIHLLENYKP